MTDYICIDVASAPIADAAAFIEVGEPPDNYSKPETIERWAAEKHAKLLAKAALDLDLARVTAVGVSCAFWEAAHIVSWEAARIATCKDEEQERTILGDLAEDLSPANVIAVTFAGRSFDLALLQRRALYLDVPFPKLELSKYRSPHIDLCELLSGHEPHRRHSLDFFVKRLGWTDLDPKPMDGAEEAQVFAHGEWDRLAASVARDVEAVRRLAIWAGVMP